MAQLGKLENVVAMKAPYEKFEKFVGSQSYNVPNACPHMNGIKLIAGDWGQNGAIKQWIYTIDGKTEIFNEKMIRDEATKSMIFTAVGGNVLKDYKSYKVTFQPAPNGQAGSVKITCNYEKLRAGDPPPTKYYNFLLNLVKDVDAFLVKA